MTSIDVLCRLELSLTKEDHMRIRRCSVGFARVVPSVEGSFCQSLRREDTVAVWQRVGRQVFVRVDRLTILIYISLARIVSSACSDIFLSKVRISAVSMLVSPL